jgi:hypothetical protein
MRAVLLLVVMMAWITCLLGAVGCTVYVAARALRLLGRRAPAAPIAAPAPQGVVAALVVFSSLMAVAAVGLAGVHLWWGRTPGSLYSALGLAALPMWAGAAAAITAIVLWRDHRALPQDAGRR